MSGLLSKISGFLRRGGSGADGISGDGSVSEGASGSERPHPDHLENPWEHQSTVLAALQMHKTALGRWYRGDPDYLKDVSQLREILSGVRGRIAVDIEGVLVYGGFIRSTWWEMGLFEQCRGERLRRPLSTEFVQGLVDSGSEVLLWTGMTREDALKVLANAGVEIPDSVRMVDRDVYRPMLYAHPVKRKIIAVADMPHVCKEELLKSVDKASMKIPGVLGVDCLVDDHAHHDGWLCEKMGMGDEVKKLVDVRSYRLETYGGFAVHHEKDRELLRISRVLAEKFSGVVSRCGV